MKVDELRKSIKGYKSDEKDKIIVELYKRIPKNVKEDYDIDSFIINLNKVDRISVRDESFEEIEKQINYFIQCVHSNLYCGSNRIISKNERSKWRFKVKKFYKYLCGTNVDSDDGDKATNLLIELYKILSYGSNYLLFSSWNTFGAIQVSQSDFLRTIVDRILSKGVSHDNVSKCVSLLECKYDPQEFHICVLNAVVDSFKTVDGKYLAIEVFKEKVLSYKEKSKKDYESETLFNYFVECVVNLYFKLSEVDNGIRYFHKNYIQSRIEVKEYILLDIIDEYNFENEWIKEYEEHLGKINYRESFQQRYNLLKERIDK